MKKKIKIIITLSCAVFLFSCAKRVGVPSKDAKVVTIPKEKLSELAGSSTMSMRILYPGDHLDILIHEKLPVSDEKRIEKKRIDERGEIFLLPVGKIQIAGLTQYRAEEKIMESLSKYVVSPYCEINVSHSERRIFVFGDVLNAGWQELRPGFTVLDALAAAGSHRAGIPGRIGTNWHVKIIRPGEDGVSIISVDLKDVLKRGKISENILLENHDIVFMPRRLITDVFQILKETAAVLPWIYLLVNNA